MPSIKDWDATKFGAVMDYAGRPYMLLDADKRTPSEAELKVLTTKGLPDVAVIATIGIESAIYVPADLWFDIHEGA
jgi:hypothetical protein